MKLKRFIFKGEWKVNAPWYCEAQNGLNWIAYCKNEN